MGLVSGLLLFPVMGPLHGLHFIVKRIAEEVDAQRFDEGRVQAELINLSVRRDLGEISDEEYRAQEAALAEQLNVIRAQEEALMVSDTYVDSEAHDRGG